MHPPVEEKMAAAGVLAYHRKLMAKAGIKRLLVSLALIASLLIGHASACACPRHVETEAVESADCHTHHETTGAVETDSDGNVCDTSCVCVIEQSPFLASNAPSKQFKASYELAKPAQTLPDLDVAAIRVDTQSSPAYVHDLSYLSTLKSLLPSRAPPRL